MRFELFPVSSAVQKLRDGISMHCVLSRSDVMFVFLFEGSHYLQKEIFFFLFFSTQFLDMLLSGSKTLHLHP